MSAELTYEWNSAELAVWRGNKVESALARALRLAGNQAIRALKVDETRLVLSKKNLPEPLIAEDQTLSLPSRKEQISAFVWGLYIRGKPIPMVKFPHVDTRRGAKVGVVVRFGNGAPQTIASAFTATMKSGHTGVFRRIGAATRTPTQRYRGYAKYAGQKRQPIEELFSYRLPAQLGGQVRTTLFEKTHRKLVTAFARGLDREMKKLVRKGEA